MLDVDQVFRCLALLVTVGLSIERVGVATGTNAALILTALSLSFEEHALCFGASSQWCVNFIFQAYFVVLHSVQIQVTGCLLSKRSCMPLW